MERHDGGSLGRIPEALAGTPLPAVEHQEAARDPARDQEESRQPPTTVRREAPQGAERVDDAVAARNFPVPRIGEKLDSAADAFPGANVERVVSAARASLGRGGMEVHLRLHPESLGEVRVQVRWEGGTLSARLEAATPAARDALESGAPALRAALQEHGISLDRLSVNMRMDSEARSQHRHLAPENPMLEEPVPERANRTVPIPIPEPVSSARVDIRI
jgi:flagellar hook-length control protein FliK